MKIKLYLISFFLFMFLLAGDSFAYPKFAAYTGEKCQSCHINPTGGGIRNTYGLKYSKDNLYMKPFEKAQKTMEMNPMITKGLQIGADMRMIFINDETGEGSPNFNTFFQMQADLYVNAQINKYLNLVLNPGLYIPNTFGSSPLATKSEIYGMVSGLPAEFYIKAGRFIPNWGTKIPEHRAYNRQLNDFYTPYAADAGIEMGIAPSFFTLTASLTNGSSPNKDGMRVNSFDFDNQKQFTTSADFRWAAKKNKYTFGLGGSFLTNPFKWDAVNNVNALRQAVVGFLSIGIMERVAILGEYTYNRLQLRDSISTKREFNTMFAELNIRVTKGMEFKVQFESADPSLGFKNSTNERKRYSFGLMFFPMTGLEIEGIYRIVEEGKGDSPTPFKIKNNEYQATFKFYY